MTRREAAEKVFAYIRENKFEPINIEYGNGYFVFDMGEDSVVHFDIKGLYGWKFAMWIETNPENLKEENGEYSPAIQFFCQHKLNIDKFKPSRSFHLAKLSLEDLEEAWTFYQIRDILQMIKRHPLVAFTMDATERKYCDRSYFKIYLKAVYYGVKARVKKRWNDTYVRIWQGLKVLFINKYKIVDKAELIDNNNDYWEASPRYNMKIHFTKISDDENIQETEEIKMLRVWFRKNYYENMYLSLTREGADGQYFYTDDDKRKVKKND